MIEKQLFDLVNARVIEVDAAAAESSLRGLFVHDNLFRTIDTVNKPDGIRFHRPDGVKVPGIGSGKIIEADCSISTWIYVRVNDTQDGGDVRAAAFERADAIANELILWMWNGGLPSESLRFANADVDFSRVDHSYDSTPYAVVVLRYTVSEVEC